MLQKPLTTTKALNLDVRDLASIYLYRKFVTLSIKQDTLLW